MLIFDQDDTPIREMSWYYLIFAALIDTVYGVAIYHSKGFSLLKPTVLALCAAATTSYFLALAMRGIPAGISFAVWSGIGTLGVVIYGIVALGETINPARIVMMGLIVIGVAGLKIMSPT